MTYQWYFKPKEEGDTIREAVHGEFFAADAISNPGTALVREGIQNALDAGRPSERVLVRIYVSGNEQTARRSSVEPYLHGIWEHLRAKDNGLKHNDVPSDEVPCPYFAFEDFGTTGLQGDPAEAFRPREHIRNQFYHFFRAEGQSDKGESDRGSWGVGKHVFVRSSHISTVFGLTVRADDRKRMFMGKSVLRSHWVDDRYCQDGYFGVQPKSGDHLVMPIADDGVIKDFSTVFGLQRGNEAGLSVVVPWPDPEITDEEVVRAVLQDYFYPILVGQLEVIVETPTIETILDADSLVREVQKLDESVAGELGPLLELAEWARDVPADGKHELRIPEPEHAWQWSEELFPADLLTALRNDYLQGERIAITVPVTVRKRDYPQERSHFSVYLVRDEQHQRGRPVFIREGIIIPRVDPPRTRGIRAIVVAEDRPLAAFLRTAENPSHTEWQHIRLKDQYKFGSKTDLEFVKGSVHQIVRLLTAAEREEDPTLLVDLFSLPASPEEEDAVGSRMEEEGERPGKRKTKEVKPPPRSPQHFRIQKIQGGFAIVPGDKTTTVPATLEIQVAYDVRRGNPLRKYNPADFRVDQPPIRFDPPPESVTVRQFVDNRIVIEVEKPHFSFHVTGFDERRQLYVRATSREGSDADKKI